MRSLLLVLGILAVGAVGADEATMDAEIDHLLDAVAASDCTFIRNGKEHDAKAARDHLSTKRRRGRRYFDTAEEFIDRIASKSSWSGKDYRIRCDGEEQTAQAWFTAVLDRYRNPQ